MKKLKLNVFLVIAIIASGSFKMLKAAIEDCTKYKTKDDCINNNLKDSCN
jgi:hypothetical protein